MRPTLETGMVSLMACLGLVMAMGAEGLTMAGEGAAASCASGMHCTSLSGSHW